MSTRSGQARQLARALSAQYEREVEVLHGGQDRWYVQWANGPTWKQMMMSVGPLLAQYPLLADRRLTSSRSTSPPAWAARAAAALRDGSLARAVAAYQPSRPVRPGDRLTPAEHAALQHVDRLLDETENPDLPDSPVDVPVITRLLATGLLERRRYADRFTMVGPLLQMLAGEPDPRALPDNVIPLRRKG